MQNKIDMICKLLNLENNPYVINDVISETESIFDLDLFTQYAKAKFNYEKYKYLNGYQKFIALTNDFKREFQPTLQDEQLVAVGNYSEELYRRTTNLFDELQWLVNSGISLDNNVCKEMIYKTFKNRDKDIKVLKKIGDKKELYRLNISSKDKLKDKIYEVVHNLTVAKTYPQIEHKSKDKLMIELINSKI